MYYFLLLYLFLFFLTFLDIIAEMLAVVNPAQSHLAEEDIRQRPWLPEEGHHLCLTSSGIWIRGEPEIVLDSIVGDSLHHVTKS